MNARRRIRENSQLIMPRGERATADGEKNLLAARGIRGRERIDDIVARAEDTIRARG